jgi:hypothetical protein
MDLAYHITVKGPVLEGKAPQIAHEQVTAFLSEATQFLETQVRTNTPEGVFGEAGGGLRATIHGEVVDKGTEVQKGIIGHTSLYGDPMERGRRPGKMAPSAVLVRWVELKFNVSGSEARRIAFFVRKKIMSRGTKGAAMFFKALDEGWPEIVAMADRYGIRIADRMRG